MIIFILHHRFSGLSYMYNNTINTYIIHNTIFCYSYIMKYYSTSIYQNKVETGETQTNNGSVRIFHFLCMEVLLWLVSVPSVVRTRLQCLYLAYSQYPRPHIVLFSLSNQTPPPSNPQDLRGIPPTYSPCELEI